MRELTPSEHRTLLAILALPGSTERERIRWSHLPSSTYNVVKRRLYAQGWVEDRWVPQPGPLGFSEVELRLERPFAAERGSLERVQSSDLSRVLLWSGVHGVLSVAFREDAGDAPGGHLGQGRDFVVRARPREGSVPVYFDYSGLWARFAGETIPPEYPRGLDLRPAPAPDRERAAARRAVGGLGPPDAEETSHRWTNLLRLPRSQRRAVVGGLVSARSLPNLARLPPWEGRRLGEVLLVVGRARDRSAPSRLLNALTKDRGVFPFLFAEGHGSVLLAGIGQTSARDPGRVPVRSARGSVLSTINAHLDQVEVLIEPVEGLRAVVDHRYASLFAGDLPFPPVGRGETTTKAAPHR
ncbi:MAG: hypothetical protein KGJ23_14580 [Euryarchaeota archaeon]|nr:hypothetical protein [Euryarchaeota archaeon]MDE1837826.1 hypothetical protein [Euryarchaeota archaeon]MDE1880100.1 hypothetical protein [Euryarchaeota archaeon]MDE2045062.1 hypothetical protein [Thermoplasmata archaeon]